MSYDPTDLSELNMAREALGDTSNDAAAELLTDDHIQAVIDENGYNLAVALLAEGLVARFAQKPTSVGLPSGLSVAWSKRLDAWIALAARYRGLATQETAAATAGLTSRAATVAVW